MVAVRGEKNQRGVAACATPPVTHESTRALYLCFVESADIIDVESIEPPIAVLSELIVDDEAAGGVSSAFLPQPTTNEARASAISVRAKSLRIVCTFTSSHAATPVINRSGRVFPSASPGLRKKHHWQQAVSVRIGR